LVTCQAAEKGSDGGNGRKWTTVRLSSGISANILDFGIPQKDVVTDMAAQETGRKAGGGEVQACDVQIQRQAGARITPIPTAGIKGRKQGQEPRE
jgi:hypothetical protein